MAAFCHLALARANARQSARVLAHLVVARVPNGFILASCLSSVRRATDRLTLLLPTPTFLFSFPETMHEKTHNYNAITDARFFTERSINNLQRVETETLTKENLIDYGLALNLLKEAKQKLNQLSQQKP